MKDWFESSDFKKYCSDAEYKLNDCQQAMLDHWNSDDAEEYMYYALRTDHYAELVDSDSCVNEVYFSSYEKYKKDYDSDDESALMIVVSAVFAIII